MPSLNEAQWRILREEWELGVLSEHALAEKYNIDRKQIQRRKAREGWVRNPEVTNVIALEAVRDLGRRLSPPPPSGDATMLPSLSPPVPTVAKSVFTPELAAKLEEIGKRQAVETALEIISRTSERHLGMTRKLHRAFEFYHALLEEILVGDEASAEQAARRIMSGKNDSVAAALATLVRTAEAIQAMERKALGLEVPLKGGATGTTQDAGIVRNEDGLPVIDVSILSDQQLAMLQRAAALLEQHGRTELPLPPQGPGSDG